MNNVEHILHYYVRITHRNNDWRIVIDVQYQFKNRISITGTVIVEVGRLTWVVCDLDIGK